jgi:hypothetical protein
MRWIVRRLRSDRGTTTTEYAIMTLVAGGFATLLFLVIHSAAVRAALTRLILTALHLGN